MVLSIPLAEISDRTTSVNVAARPQGALNTVGQERGQVVRPSDVRQVQADIMSVLLINRFHRTRRGVWRFKNLRHSRFRTLDIERLFAGVKDK